MILKKLQYCVKPREKESKQRRKTPPKQLSTSSAIKQPKTETSAIKEVAKSKQDDVPIVDNRFKVGSARVEELKPKSTSIEIASEQDLKPENNNIDIFSENFFAESPFDNRSKSYYDEPTALSFELYALEEDLCHSHDFHLIDTFSFQPVLDSTSLRDETPTAATVEESIEDSAQQESDIESMYLEDDMPSNDSASGGPKTQSNPPAPNYKQERSLKAPTQLVGEHLVEISNDDQNSGLESTYLEEDSTLRPVLPREESDGSFSQMFHSARKEGQKEACDTATHTTCRSTESPESGYDMESIECHPPQSHVHEQSLRILPTPQEKEKAVSVSQNSPSESSPSLRSQVLRQQVEKQEQQIQFLRHKLQEYADLCDRYNIGKEILGQPDQERKEVLPTESILSGTTRTTYKEKTYAELIGPWNIPFHVEVQPQNSFGEYSGVTFAQHPSKVRETECKIRGCSAADDGALPVTRRYHQHSVTSPRTSRSSQKVPTHVDCSPARSAAKVSSTSQDNPGKVSGRSPPRKSHSKKTHRKKTITPREEEEAIRHTRHMSVFLERKYGRQKALYSGTVHATSGCPHGVGTFVFVQSGDEYNGEVAYGEMHGKGAYHHQKTNKWFRGNFERNSFVGATSGDKTGCEGAGVEYRRGEF